MAELKTTYLGLALKNPFIVGASGYTADLERIKELEAAGAAAVVTASLFEEQIQYERYRLDEELHRYDNLYAEMLTLFPEIEHAGPHAHLTWVRRTKEAVGIPVIASLNAVEQKTWVEWAMKLEQTGADALELNFYATPSRFDFPSATIEDEQVVALREIKRKVKIPVSVKLSPYYTNLLAFLKRLEGEGVDGYVLFNRLFQPDIDVEEEKNLYGHLPSQGGGDEHRLSLRYAGLLFGSLRGDLCAGGGILSAGEAAKLLLAGSACVQVVSALYQNRIEYLSTLIKELGAWMERKGYRDLAAFRGKMSARNNPDPHIFSRAQYVKQLLRADYPG